MAADKRPLPRSARELRLRWLAGALALATLGGCHWKSDVQFSDSWNNYQAVATQIEFPDAQIDPDELVRISEAPHTLRRLDEKPLWNLTLDEAIQIALSTSEVMRDIGGRVVATPQTVATPLDPAMQEVSPISGTEAALSDFDAQLNASLLLAHNERTFNNVFFGGGTTGFKQNTGDFVAEILKPTATGTVFGFRNITNYDRNTSPANRFPGVYETMFETDFRHPLLQGGGMEFQRIAGPNAQPGVYNGVLIARINTDVAIADFEIAVRNLVRDVEQTYWDLYFAYRDLDAKRESRDAALRLWNIVQSQLEAGTAEAERESLVREQYYAAQTSVEEALSGGITSPGVYTVERRLRRLMGLPATDERLIRPADEPQLVEVEFDWRDSLVQSFWRRPELRRQQWQIKRRELELTAARSFRLPSLDAVGLYRWRGFGDDLFGNPNFDNASAFADLFTGDLQEWQAGLQLTTPIGDRLGHAAVRHAELQLARERAIHRQQELQISHELADAFADLDRAFVVIRSNYNRQIAAYQQVRYTAIKWEAGSGELEFYLDAIRRATVAETLYYRAVADYGISLMQIHAARGTLLERHGIALSEGPWSAEAHEAAAKESRRFGPYRLEHCYEVPCPISIGAVEAEDVYGVPAPAKPLSEPIPEPPPVHVEPEPAPDAPLPQPEDA